MVVTSVEPKSLKSCFHPPGISMPEARVIGSWYEPPATRTIFTPFARALACASLIVAQGFASGPQSGPVLPPGRTWNLGFGSTLTVIVMPGEVEEPSELVIVSFAV